MSKDNFDELADVLLNDSDIDNDGVLNLDDCSPLDDDYQDLTGALKSAGGKIKSAAKKVKSQKKEWERQGKFEEYRQKTKAQSEKRRKWREEKQELREKLSKLKKKRELAEAKKGIQQEKKALEEAKPPGMLDKIGDKIGSFLSSRGAPRRGARAKKGNVDRDDRWAVVYYSEHVVVATFRYKSDAMDYKSQYSDGYGVMKTKTALRRGYKVTQKGAYDIFGPSGNEMADDISSFVIGSGPTRGKTKNDEEFDKIMKDVVGW